MPIDYTILSLACPRCPETFLVATELANHHLAAHERPWPEPTPLPPEVAPQAPAEDCPVCHHAWPLLRTCSRCGPQCAACYVTIQGAWNGVQQTI